MPDISFYILSSQTQSERNLFACKLIEKAYRHKQFCYIYTDTPEQSKQLDDQLWTFRPSSFIPHQIYDGVVPEYEHTILIGTQKAPLNWQKTIINLSSKYPNDLEQTTRILEILDEDEEMKHTGRLRYRQYSQAGFTIKTHKIN